MYSVLLFLLVVILAPIALRSLFALLINPLFWGLLLLGGLFVLGIGLNARRMDAEYDARVKQERAIFERQQEQAVARQQQQKQAERAKEIADAAQWDKEIEADPQRAEEIRRMLENRLNPFRPYQPAEFSHAHPLDLEPYHNDICSCA